MTNNVKNFAATDFPTFCAYGAATFGVTNCGTSSRTDGARA